MNVEENRLRTFNEWPADASVSPQRIAKAGFYSTKQGLEVECFACGGKISNWNYGDQVMARHRNLNPQCPFVLNLATSGNIPCVASPLSIPSSSTPDYRNEVTRLASFENWPIPDIVTPEALAKAGFYSLRNGDNTKCAFCKGVVRAWEPTDIPDFEHKRHFPTCPFVVNVINPRIENNENPSSRAPYESEFKNVYIINNAVDGSLDELGVQKHIGPKRMDYGTVEARLRSFRTWSPHLIQTADVLAQAGFYYEGMGDQVRCFHCDGGLRHWNPDDDPWTEHARWFPRCSFVNMVKGQEFVMACAIDSVNADESSPTDKVIAPKKWEVDSDELRRHTRSKTARAVLDMGIDVQRVIKAIRDKLELTGEGYSKPDALAEAALNVQLPEDEHILTIDNTDEAKKPNIPQEPTKNGECPSRQPDLVGKLEKSISLEEENRVLKEARQCKICMDGEVGIVFLPCGHLATCVNCAPNLEDCPVCRSAIKATVRTFLS